MINFSPQEMFQLKTQAAMYPKYKTSFDEDRYDYDLREWENDDDASYDRPTREEYTDIDYGFYKSRNWQKVADAIRIKNINSTNDLRSMYEYVNKWDASFNTPKQQPKAQPAPKPYTPQPSNVTRNTPKPTPAPPAAAKPKTPTAPPAPVYKPTIYNQASSVNNNALKIASSYQSPTIGGTSRFRRSSSARNFNTNPSMRINNSLTV
tara:strand:- start:325 stop:945 length:621 start_codon:yes stop_codon:yes gene_type:complete